MSTTVSLQYLFQTYVDLVWIVDMFSEDKNFKYTHCFICWFDIFFYEWSFHYSEEMH